MKNQFVGKLSICDQELQVKNFNKCRWPVKIQLLVTTQEAHAGYESDQAEIMVPMQVGDKYMIDPASPDFVLIHLCLGTLPAIHEEKVIVKGDHLGRRMPVECRNSRVISKYGYREHCRDLFMINRAGRFV